MGHKIKENNVPVGTWGNKYDSKNPIKNRLLKDFIETIISFAQEVENEIETICEFGCGEGYVTSRLGKAFPGKKITGTDYSDQIVDYAREHNSTSNITYKVKDVYEISERDKADLILCCEVLEHLEEPERAVANLAKATSRFAIISVPREPHWRLLQLASLNHVTALGNTPGHINHWSSQSITNLLQKYFEILKVKTPLPWTVIIAKRKNN